MSGLFGTKAGVAADLNLLLQIIIFFVILIGIKFGRDKTPSSLKTHGRITTVAVVLQGIAIIFVMGPSFIGSFGTVLSEFSVLGFPLTLIHVFFGGISEILGIIFVFRKFGNVRWWMRILAGVWTISLFLGILVYALYYIS